MKPLLRFRAFVEASKKGRAHQPAFFWCTLWPNLAQARARMKQLGIPNPDAAGAMASWDTYEVAPGKDRSKDYLKPEMGEIILALSYSGASTICHECAHAAFRLTERMKEWKIKDWQNETIEERHCLTVGYMTRQIIRRLIALERKQS